MYQEAHPIPQNVSDFQFHLVGDMTLRQFGYLATGLGLAYLFFVVLFPAAPVIAIPFIVITALSGFAFAFLPILDRPLDHWVKAYFKAIYSPTRAKWEPPSVLSSEDEQSIDNIFKNRLQFYLTNSSQETKNIVEPEVAAPVEQPKVESSTQPSENNKPKLEFKKIDAESVRSDPFPHPPAQIATIPSLRPLKPKNPILHRPASASSDNSKNKPTQMPTHHQTINRVPLSAQPQSTNDQNELDFNPRSNKSLKEMQFYFAQPAPLKNPVVQQSAPIPTTQTHTRPNPIPQLSTAPQPIQHPVQLTVSSSPQIPPEQSKLPSSEELNKLVKLAEQGRMLQLKLQEAEKQINQITATAANPTVAAEEYKQKYQQIFNRLQTLVQQADQLSKETGTANIPVPQVVKPVVKVVEPPKPAQTTTTQILLTSQPNVINGIVTDSTGNYLDGVIVIIHDKNNLPVRALKTNKIGQFTGATPLPPGDYTVTLEKDSLEFDTLQVTLNGEVMPPLQISAKKTSINGHI